MSWLADLHAVYERSYGNEPDGSALLAPIAHTTQQAHITVVLDASGRFLRAEVIDDKAKATTLIPCTESSGGRSGSKPTAHPLCDKLQYVAADFMTHGGEVTSGFSADTTEPHRLYLKWLADWAASDHGHPKLDAVLTYVKKGQLVADLIAHQILPVDAQGQMLKQWDGEKTDAPAIFKALPPGQAPEDAFVRWQVDTGAPAQGTWEDPTLFDAWVAFYGQSQTQRGFCMVEGVESALASQHPAKLRHAADKAKLISANDSTGFTFRGRFLESEQAVGVGYVVTQKAHNALRWLIERQGRRNGDQVIVAWSTRHVDIIQPVVDTFGFIGAAPLVDGSAGQHFAIRLKRAIDGYRATLEPDEHVIVMGLDAATPGRMSITYYRRLRASEFLDRIEQWHAGFAWPQCYGKTMQFIGAPAPRDIAEAAYGKRLDDKLKSATCERLLPCIVDALPFPQDLVKATFARAINRVGQEWWEWEKALGIACALFRGSHIERNYQMALERDRASRDYLFGRLLALADNIEQRALTLAGEQRETNAARYMTQFANRPSDAWRMLYAEKLLPYISRLNHRERGFLENRKREIDQVFNLFQADDFNNDPLGGEFLLGYHCQRAYLLEKKSSPEAMASLAETTE